MTNKMPLKVEDFLRELFGNEFCVKVTERKVYVLLGAADVLPANLVLEMM